MRNSLKHRPFCRPIQRWQRPCSSPAGRRSIPGSQLQQFMPMLHSFVLPLLVAVGLQAPAPPQPKNEDAELCLSCHGDRQMSVSLPSGETRGLFVDAQAFARSVHGGKLGCTDCHTDMTEVPHATKPFRDEARVHDRVLRGLQALPLRQLQQDARQRALRRRSPAATRWRRRAWTATARTTSRRPTSRESRISQTCAACHSGVSATYAKSVHGRALIEERTRTCRPAPTATGRTTSPARTRRAGGSRARSCAPAATPTRR